MKHKLKQAEREFLSELKDDIDFPVQCVYCGAWLTSATHTFDHVVPLSKGGAKYGQNLANCCHACNEAKADMSAAEYRQKLAAKSPTPPTIKETTPENP